MLEKELIASELAKQIKEIVDTARKKVINITSNTIVIAYWQVGEVIVTKERHSNLNTTSGSKVILELSKILTKEIGRGFSRSSLFCMRSFYMNYKDVQTLSGQLTWSHYCELLTITDKDKRSFSIE